jgi:recombination protein RecT
MTRADALAGPPPVTNPNAVARPDTFQEVVRLLDDPRTAVNLADLLGTEREVAHFRSVALHAISTNSKLLRDCTPLSIVLAVKDAAALDLEPTGLMGEGAIIPYKTEAKFQPMYRGLLKLCFRSDRIEMVDCQVVYGKDFYESSLGTQPFIHHVPTRELDRGGYKLAYAWAKLRGAADPLIDEMTEADINTIREQFSRNQQDSPWDTSWGEMARKTVLKRLMKKLGAMVDDRRIAQALDIDNAAEPIGVTVSRPSDAVNQARLAARRAVGLPAGEPPPEEPGEAEPLTTDEVVDTLNSLTESSGGEFNDLLSDVQERE